MPIAHATGALVIADMVTSLGAMPIDMASWDVDVCYSCSQKGLGAPSGLAPLVFSPAALARRVPCRSFYLDLSLLSAFWLDRKYHHTISAPLVYALHAALQEVEEEGLPARWARHESVHHRLVEGWRHAAWRCYRPPPAAVNLNAVRVPDGVGETAIRRLLARHQIIGAGLGRSRNASGAWA